MKFLTVKPKKMRINVEGKTGKGVTAKDIILYITSKISASGGTGYFIEYAGSAIRDLSMEGRMTICNQVVDANVLIDEHAAYRQDIGFSGLFRVAAYRKAAATLRGLKRPVQEIVPAEGHQGLIQLEGIGRSIAHSIEQLLRTGRMPLLQRLRGESAPIRVFATVADIGPKLADRIHEALGIESLSELQAAALDCRLARVPGFGGKRVQAVRESLAGRSRQQDRAQRAQRQQLPAPSQGVGELLDIDRVYRRLAAANRLPRIAPRRFNPEGKAWLPVLHTHRVSGTTQPSSLTPLARMNWEPRATGSSSIATTTVTMGNGL